MSDFEFGEIIKDGYKTWKNNLILCIPFILGGLLSAIMAGIILVITFLSLFWPLIKTVFSNPSSIASSEFLSQLYSIITSNLISIIAVFVIIAIIVGLIFSFFYSGAIGMAKEALLTGKTNLSHMMDYGKRKYLNYFFASIIVGLIFLIGVLFLIPGILSVSSEIGSSGFEFSSQNINAYFPLIIGFLIMIPYMVIMSIIFALVSYAVVIDDLSAIEGVKKGFRVFWHNKLSVFIIWLIVGVISFLFGLIGIIPIIGGILSLIVTFLIVVPLTTIWWSKFYLTISKT